MMLDSVVPELDNMDQEDKEAIKRMFEKDISKVIDKFMLAMTDEDTMVISESTANPGRYLTATNVPPSGNWMFTMILTLMDNVEILHKLYNILGSDNDEDIDTLIKVLDRLQMGRTIH